MSGKSLKERAENPSLQRGSYECIQKYSLTRGKKREKSRAIIKILQGHEKRISALEKKSAPKITLKAKTKNWYKSGSTIEKIVILIGEGFFNKPKSLKEIISKLETKDYHLKASDLTLPLRKVVRKGLLRKTKEMLGGIISKNWLYVKA